MKEWREKTNSFPDAIEGPTDAIALRRDGNLRSRLKFRFDFLVIDDVHLILSAAFTGPLERVFSWVWRRHREWSSERERESLKQLIESQVFRGVKK